MDDHDRKEWLVSRIDYKHDNYLEEYGINEERFKNWSETIDRSVKNGRNYIFSVIGAGLSFILVLLSTNLLDLYWFTTYLVVIAVCATLTFFLTTIFSSRMTLHLNVLTSLAINSQDKISQSRNYFTTLSSNLEILTLDALHAYSSFVVLLINATLIPILVTYTDWSKSKWIQPNVLEAFEETMIQLKNQIELNTNISPLLSDENLPPFLVKFIKEQFMGYEEFRKGQ